MMLTSLLRRHFNAANHSISDIKVCAISPISGGNDSLKRHEKRLIFKIGTIHPHGLNELSFIWSFSFIVSVFVQQGRTKALTSHLSLHCLCSSTSHSFISRLRLVYWSTLKIANDLPIFASYYAFGLYLFTRFFIYFLFLSDEGPMLETLDHTISIGSTPTFFHIYIYIYINWQQQWTSKW